MGRESTDEKHAADTRRGTRDMVRSRVRGVRRRDRVTTPRVTTSHTGSTTDPIRKGKSKDKNGAHLCPRQRARLIPILRDMVRRHEVESAEGVGARGVEE